MSAYYPVKNPYQDEIPVIFIAGDADINDINDQCLLTIFDYLPMNDLMRMTQICTRWNNLHERACLRRHHISVLIGFSGYSCSQFIANSDFYVPSPRDVISDDGTQIIPSFAAISSQLRLPHLNNGNTFQMTRKCTQITHLELVFAQNFFPLLDQYMVMYLLNQWSANLVSFKLRAYTDKFTMQNQVSKHESNFSDSLYTTIKISPQLLQTINGLSALKHLTLECWPLWVTESDVRLTILSQLDEFYICAPDKALLSLMRYLDADKIRRIGVVPKVNVPNDLIALLAVESNFASRFTHIGDMSLTFLMQLSQLQHLCTNFTSLTNLRVDVTNIPISQWTRCLSQLKQLFFLSLTDYNCNIFSDNDAHSIVKKEDPDGDQSIAATANLSKLRSVKTLHLRCYLKSHLDLFSINFHWIFPNIELIHLDLQSYNCSICQIAFHNDFTWSMANIAQRSQCTRMLLHPLGKCRRTLRNIYTNQTVIDGRIKAILPWNDILQNATNFY